MRLRPTPLRRSRHRAAALCAAVALAACAGAQRAPEPGRRAFEVPGRGALEIAVPAGWTATAVEGEGPASVTIRLEKPGARFVATLTPYRDAGPPPDPEGRAATARTIAELARRQALATSIEAEIQLEEGFAGAVRAFWFEATDAELSERSAGPDEYRHVLQGAAAVGPLVFGFALLDDEPGPQRDDILDLVRGARAVGAPGRPARPAAQDR